MLLTARARAASALARAAFAPREPVSRIPFRVWPTDVDLNVHLTNSRYNQIMDCGRLDWLVRGGLLPVLARERLRPVAVELQIRFLRELPLGRRFVLETRATGRDRKAVVVSQRFLVGEVEHAVARVNLLVLGPDGVVEPTALAPLLPTAAATEGAADQVQGSVRRRAQ